MMKSLRILLGVFTLWALTACQAPGVMLKETPLGVSETRKVIVSVIGDPRSVSSNGRELFSKYYDKKGLFIEEPEKVKTRYYTKVVILGDRRPYDIAVQVFFEGKSGGFYELIDEDDGRANTIAKKIEKSLSESRDNRNVIDDFRSF